MALSPPNASNAGLWARHAAPRAKMASTVIQPIVMACIQTMRRTTSREFASTVEDIDLFIMNAKDRLVVRELKNRASRTLPREGRGRFGPISWSSNGFQRPLKRFCYAIRVACFQLGTSKLFVVTAEAARLAGLSARSFRGCSGTLL